LHCCTMTGMQSSPSLRTTSATCLDREKTVSLLFVVWSVGIAVRFLHTMLKAAPFNPGADRIWVAVWFFTSGLVLLAVALLPTKISRSIWLLPLLGLASVLGLS